MFVDSVLNSAANMADTPQIVQEPYSDTSSRGLHHREQRMSDTDKEEKCGSDGGKMEVFETELNGENGQEGHRHLKILPLAMIIFYNVSGGPFGMEESVRSAGFLFSILGFIIMPIVWSIPEALVTAELGSTYPEASGGVAWADEAFGPAAGWMTGYLGWMAGATDSKFIRVDSLFYVTFCSSLFLQSGTTTP